MRQPERRDAVPPQHLLYERVDVRQRGAVCERVQARGGGADALEDLCARFVLRGGVEGHGEEEAEQAGDRLWGGRGWWAVRSVEWSDTERLQVGEKFQVNHPEISGGSYLESCVQLLLPQARRWRESIDFVDDISRTFQSNFAGHHHIARRPERVNTRY